MGTELELDVTQEDILPGEEPLDEEHAPHQEEPMDTSGAILNFACCLPFGGILFSLSFILNSLLMSTILKISETAPAPAVSSQEVPMEQAPVVAEVCIFVL